MITLDSTPVEAYSHKGFRYLVKREDLCTQPPGPPFSKIRGLMVVLERLKSEGIKHVGYVETSVSMAGCGVAWGCKQLGLEAVIYNPIYKETPALLACHRSKWEEAGATIFPIKAGMARVNYNICRNTHREKYGKSGVVLPLGLPFKETIEATHEEALSTFPQIQPATVVVNIGSGTVCAGLMRAITPGIRLYGIMGRTGSIERKKATLIKKSGVPIGGMLGIDMKIIDPGWEYTERSEEPCPFPSHPYYDLKAYQWMVENLSDLKGAVLFWNIGSIYPGVE